MRARRKLERLALAVRRGPSNARSSSARDSSSAATLDARTRSKRARVVEHRRVAARAHVGDDRSDRRVDRLVLRRVERRSAAARLASKSGADESRRGDLRHAHLAAAAAIASMQRLHRWSRFSLSAAGLTISRALIGQISSTATRSFAFSVLPVLDQVDDRVGEPHQRRQLHRAVEPDQVDVHALAARSARARSSRTWSRP